MYFERVTLICVVSISVLVVSVSSAITRSRANTLVVGGSNVTSFSSHPWMVAIFERSPHTGEFNFICGGALISRWTILTAAHCLSRQNPTRHISPSDIRVKYGLINLEDASQELKLVQSIKLHPRYAKPVRYHDLALMDLQEPVLESDTRSRSITLFSSEVSNSPSHNSNVYQNVIQELEGLSVMIAGWGTKSWSDPVQSDVLQEAQIQVSSQSACNSSYGALRVKKFAYPEGNLC